MIWCCNQWYATSSFHTACAEGDVRLMNETSDFSNRLSTFRGQLVVCIGGAFQPICDIGWDNNDAQVACVLRYGSRFGKEEVIWNCMNSSTSFSVCLPKIVPQGHLLVELDCCCVTDGEAVFGLPVSPNASYVAQDVMCNGTEFSIAQCPFSPPTPACYEGNHGAGIICRESEISSSTQTRASVI